MDDVGPVTWFLSAFAGALLVGALMLGVFAYEGGTFAQHHDVSASVQASDPSNS